MIEDEFTIPRPKWIVPVAIIGALLLTIAVAFAALQSSEDPPPPVRTGTSVVTTTTK